MNRSKVILIAFVAAVAMIAGYSYWIADSDSRSIVISGIIEADDIHVGSKIGGRVLKVVAKRGQTVKAGETLVLLEPNDIDASYAEAQAGLRQAEAKYALLTAGYRNEEIEQAEAAVKQAQAELDQFISGPRQQEIDQVAAEWKAAKAQAENAQKFLQRMDGLAKRELIARQEYDDALAKT